MFEEITNYIKPNNINFGRNIKTPINLTPELSGIDRNREYQRQYRRLYKQNIPEEKYKQKLEKHKEYMKTYSIKNAEKLKQYHTCEICSKPYQLYNKSQHNKTKHHLNFISQLSN